MNEISLKWLRLRRTSHCFCANSIRNNLVHSIRNSKQNVSFRTDFFNESAQKLTRETSTAADPEGRTTNESLAATGIYRRTS